LRTITLGRPALTLDALDECLDQALRVQLTPDVVARIQRGRDWAEALLQSGQPVYGVNTGFGSLKNRRIQPADLDRLQANLVISHAVGVGPPVPPEIVRWMLLFKIHMLAQGHSGVSVELVQRLCGWLNADVLPVVPTRGSLGASGDLAPLAHLALPLLGRGHVWVRDESAGPAAPGRDDPSADIGTSPRGGQVQGWRCTTAAEALGGVGVAPLPLAAKEGLALLNGTQLMSAYGANIAVRARRLIDLADLIACTSIEGVRGSARPADERLHRLRPHPGAQVTAANIRDHLQESDILASHADCDRIQDPYSLRCVPQVHGAFRDALEHVAAMLEREINSVTDNPVLFGPEPPADADGAPEALSGGNFHGAPLALGLDYLAIALTDLASISERRTYLLLSGCDGLPTMLMRDSGLNSGFMIAQYTAAALVNECKVLSTPASVDTIPTSMGQEDHVSMGATSALKCFEVLDRVETVLAIELLCGAQALDFRAPLRAGRGPRAAHAILRERVTHADADREYHDDIRAVMALLRGSAELRAIASRRAYGHRRGRARRPGA
jgi:histidine ammonia-lyase